MSNLSGLDAPATAIPEVAVTAAYSGYTNPSIYEQTGESRVAQHLLEEGVVNVGELL